MNKPEKNELGQFIPLHYHYQMLSDRYRMESFKKAIDIALEPGYKVAELGSGTGVMSFFAAQKAKKIWAVDLNPKLVSASRKFLADNGVSDKVSVQEEDASAWLPPEPVDIVVCEMLHSGLLREKQVDVIANFREAHRKEYGTVPSMLPGATILAVQPVSQQYNFQGFYAPAPLFQSAYCTITDCRGLAKPSVYYIADYSSVTPETIDAELSLTVAESGIINALRFITKNVLHINYQTGQTIDWFSNHMVIPLPEKKEVAKGDKVSVSFSYLPGDPIYKISETLQIQ